MFCVKYPYINNEAKWGIWVKKTDGRIFAGICVRKIGRPLQYFALTVVPFGMEEGTSHRYADREFGLVVGEPAEFRFFCSASRKNDDAGLMLEEWKPEELEELAPVEVTLAGAEGEVVRVSLESDVTETGVLQLFCVAKDGRRWKLEFNVRERVA